MDWHESLAVGVDMIDEQHRSWIAHLNRVAEAVRNHEGPAEIVAALDFLIDYTKKHFAAEEKLMQEHAYPELTAHQAKHKELCETLDELVRDFNEEGATHGLAAALEEFMNDWLHRHISEVDKKLGLFLVS